MEIYGPVGLRKFLSVTFSVTGNAFPYRVYELDNRPVVAHAGASPSHPGLYIRKDSRGVFPLVDTPAFTITAAPVRHSVTCYGYVFQEKTQLGMLNIQKIKSLGVRSTNDLKRIKRGEPVFAPDGSKIMPGDVLGPEKIGRKIAILGDTFDPTPIANLAANADVLVHEATLDESLRSEAVEKGHSTSGMAGEFARKIRARNLVLTHFSPRYDDHELTTLMQEAAHTFQSTSIFAAKDHDVFELKQPPRQLGETDTNIEEDTSGAEERPAAVPVSEEPRESKKE